MINGMSAESTYIFSRNTSGTQYVVRNDTWKLFFFPAENKIVSANQAMKTPGGLTRNSPQLQPNNMGARPESRGIAYAAPRRLALQALGQREGRCYPLADLPAAGFPGRYTTKLPAISLRGLSLKEQNT